MRGRTGTGKTRCLWLLIKKLILAGHEVRFFDCLAFAHACAREFYSGEGDVWAEEIAKVQIVAFDDFGKAPFTERAEAELFALVERRTAHLLPILATLNMSGAELSAKSSKDRGDPLVRRLKEFCEVVVF